MDRANDAPAVRVPSPAGRALSGIIVRDGRFHWSGFAHFWRAAVMLFVINFVLRLLFIPSHWRDEPGLFGIRWLNAPIAGVPLAAGLLVATCLWLLTYRVRRRFNAAALPAEPGR